MMNYEQACKILDYLNNKNMGFCFLENGELVTLQDCKNVIDIYNKKCFNIEYLKT